MKTIKIIVVISFIFTNVFGQEPAMIKIEKMSNLQDLEGTWEGSGWAMSPDGTKNEFTQHEEIVRKLNGTVLLVEGTGMDPISRDVKFNALALFTYLPEIEKYSIRSYLASGESTDAEGYFEEGKFIWSFATPGGTVRYTMTFDSTTWNEFGEFSRDGEQWHKFLEMNLNKTSSK